MKNYFSLDEIVIRKGDFFQFHGNLNQGFFTSDLKHFISDFLHDLGSGIVILIHSMTETHQKFLSILNILNKLRDIFFIPNFFKHSKHSFIGPPMFGSIQRGSASSHSSVHIHSRRSQMSK
jgi:hypothetical protein